MALDCLFWTAERKWCPIDHNAMVAASSFEKTPAGNNGFADPQPP